MYTAFSNFLFFLSCLFLWILFPFLWWVDNYFSSFGWVSVGFVFVCGVPCHRGHGGVPAFPVSGSPGHGVLSGGFAGPGPVRLWALPLRGGRGLRFAPPGSTREPCFGSVAVAPRMELPVFCRGLGGWRWPFNSSSLRPWGFRPRPTCLSLTCRRLLLLELLLSFPFVYGI